MPALTRTQKPTAQPLDVLHNPDALMHCSTTQACVGLARRTIYLKMAQGTFPQPVKLGPRCVRWRSQDVLAWLKAQGGAQA